MTAPGKRTFARSALLAIVATCLFTPALPAQATAKPKAKSTQSRIEKRTYDFKEAGKEMEYGLFVPSGYDKARKTPLVVALHGLFSNPQQILHYPGLTDAAEKHGCIVVAPMGYNTRGWYGGRGPLRAGSDGPKNLSELSEKDVINVLEIVRKEYNVDPDRIYLMGHSMGGFGTLHLGIKHPDLWAGLAPIAPALTGVAADLEKARHLPVILVQGDKDILCPVAAARLLAGRMKRLDMDYEYIEVAGGDHIGVAFENMPNVFEFLSKHHRGEKPKDAAKK
jgi:poly(3-hydroxybutyrate) depolymerase